MTFTPSLLHHFTPLEVQCSPKKCKSFELHFLKKSSHCSPTLTSFYPFLAAQLSHHFTPPPPPPGSPTLTSFYPLNLSYFSPHTRRLPVLNPQPLYPQLRRLTLQTIKACPTHDGLYIPISANYPLTLTSFYPLRTNYPLTLTPFYPSWQPNSYIILPPSEQITPHSYTILTPLAAQLLHHFNPSEQITHSLLQHFVPLGSPTLSSFYHLWTNYPLTLNFG